MDTEGFGMSKCITGTMAVVGMMFLPALTLSTALAEPIPGPVLYFNPVETDQVKDDTVWRNAGTAGGEVEKGGVTPVLEEGIIEIKELRFKHEAKWYTPKRSLSSFTNGARHAKTPVVNLEDFTMGLLMKINGPFFAQEHHLVALQATPRGQVQDIRIWLDTAGNGDFARIIIARRDLGVVDDWGLGTHKIRIGEKEWHWVHLVFESGKSITFYINGEKVAKTGTGVKWSVEHDMVLHGIFAHSFGEAIRTCNCSIAIYRVYDRAFTQAEISQNVHGSYAVKPGDKLATTWGRVKQ
jgi:hypothetical protein